MGEGSVPGRPHRVLASYRLAPGPSLLQAPPLFLLLLHVFTLWVVLGIKQNQNEPNKHLLISSDGGTLQRKMSGQGSSPDQKGPSLISFPISSVIRH